jgi:hypothetical protein
MNYTTAEFSMGINIVKKLKLWILEEQNLLQV